MTTKYAKAVNYLSPQCDDWSDPDEEAGLIARIKKWFRKPTVPVFRARQAECDRVAKAFIERKYPLSNEVLSDADFKSLAEGLFGIGTKMAQAEQLDLEFVVVSREFGDQLATWRPQMSDHEEMMRRAHWMVEQQDRVKLAQQVTGARN